MRTFTVGAELLIEVEFMRDDAFANPYFFDPAFPTVTVTDSNGVRKATNWPLTRTATGKWSCYIQTDNTWIFGIYSVFVTSSDGIYNNIELSDMAFMLTGGIAQTAKGLMVSDLDAIFNVDEFCEIISYNGVAVPAVVNFGRDLSKETGITADTALSAMATIEVKASDVIKPTYRDTVVIGGDTWRVLNVQAGDGFTWQVNIIQGERPTI